MKSEQNDPDLAEVPSLTDLAQVRARLYERIGRIKAELVTMADLPDDAPSPSGAVDESPEAGSEAIAAVSPRAMAEELSALRKALKASEEACEASETARVSLLEEKVRLRGEAESARVAREEAERALTSSRDKLERVRVRTAELLEGQERIRADLERDLTAARSEVGLVTARCAARDDEVGRLEAELSWLKADTLSRSADAVREARDLGRSLAERDRLLEAARSDLEEAVAGRGVAEARVAELSGVELRCAEVETGAAKLAERVRNRDDEIARLKSESEWQKADTIAMAAEAAGQSERLQALVAERDGQIASLREVLAGAEERAAGREQALGERDALAAELSAARDRLAVLEERIRHRDEELERLRSELEWQKADSLSVAGEAAQESVRTKGLLAERDERLARLEDELGEARGAARRLEAATARVAELEAVLAEAEAVAEGRRRDVERLSHEVTELQSATVAQAGDAAKGLEHLRTGLAERDARIAALEEQVAEAAALKSRLANLQTARDELQASHERAEASLSVLTERVKSREGEVDLLRDELLGVRKDRDSAVKESGRAKSLLAERDERLTQVETELEEAAGAARRLEAAAARVRELEAVVRERDDAIRAAAAAADEQARQVERLAVEVNELRAVAVAQAGDTAKGVEILRTRLEERDSRIAALEGQAEESAALASRLASLQAARDALQAKFDEAAANVSRLSERLKSREGEVDLLREEVLELRNERGAAARETTAESQRVAALLGERAEKIKDLERRLEAVVSAEAEHEREGGTLRRRVDELEERCRALQGEVDAGAAASSSDGSLARELGNAQAELGMARGEIEKREVRLEALGREIEKLRLLREAGRKRVESVQTENLSLREELRKTARNLAEVRTLIRMIEEAGL